MPNAKGRQHVLANEIFQQTYGICKKGKMEGLEMKNIALEINNLRRLNNKGNYQ